MNKKILLIAVGTRGDVEPFLAIAELLVGNGQEVICCFPEQFRKISTDSGFPFIGLTPKFLEMLESKEGIIAMGGKANFFEKIKAYFLLYKRANLVNKIMSKEQKQLIDKENPDKIIYHIKAIYPLLYEIQNPNKTVLISPIPNMVHPIKEHAHIGFKNMGGFLNKMTYKLANYGLAKNVQNVCKGLVDKSILTSKKIQSSLALTKTVYTISPFLFNKPDSWSNHVKILGYHERNKLVNWSPSQELKSFIGSHKSILLITFGSMVNGEPEKKTQMIIRVLERLGIAAIINTGNGGLVKPIQHDSNLTFFVPNIPYDWLLPQIDFMVHHGGSGTTHMALKYGCPSLIIPHIIDQFLWNEINFKKGLGPKGISVNKIDERSFESLLRDLVSNSSYKEKTLLASKEISGENNQKELFNFITSSF